jgi:antitoxin component YwqK of YwqJK toxin-antitoxin module
MFGWLLGQNDKKILLVKIQISNNKIKLTSGELVDTKNATYYTNEFRVIKIIDEYQTDYSHVNIKTIINDKLCQNKQLKINDFCENTGIFFYLQKERALSDIYLIDNKSSGIFKQYLSNGDLYGEISVLNGKLNGIYKSYVNGELSEECEYKKNVRHGLYKKYSKGNIIEQLEYRNNVKI